MVHILKVFALGAHKVSTHLSLQALIHVITRCSTQYHLTCPSWVDFIPDSQPNSGHPVIHFSGEYKLTPPPLATPAILSFLALVNQLKGIGEYSAPLPQLDPPIPDKSRSQEWECEWDRCLSLGQASFGHALTGSFRPGR